jgi:hypothetical protein
MYRMHQFSSSTMRYPVYNFESEFRPSEQEQPQWEGPNYLELIDQIYTFILKWCGGDQLSDTGKFVYGDDVMDTENEFDFVYVFLKFLVVVEAWWITTSRVMWHELCSPYISTRHQRNVYMGYGIL